MILHRRVAMTFILGLTRPLVRFCIKHGLRLQDFIECAKAAFVIEGHAALATGDMQPSASRLSALTGLQRKEIARLDRGEFDSFAAQRDLFAKILGLWQVKDRFLTKDGKPRVLTCSSEGSEFHSLVAEVSTDISPATVLAELERVHAVEVLGDRSRVRLVLQSYVPKEDTAAGMQILANDMRDLIMAVEENLFHPQPLRNLHARTSFDRIRSSDLPKLRAWLLKEGHHFHEQVRRRLAESDQDINPDPHYRGETVEVTVGSFSFVKKES